MIKIMTLYENELSGHKGLAAGHGLSFYICTDAVQLMFDFGSGRDTWENGRKMNVPFSQISYGVFSHSHYDHSGGFCYGEAYGFLPSVVWGREEYFFQPKLSAHPLSQPGMEAYTYMGCGFSKMYALSHTRKQLVCDDQLELARGCWAVGNFERTCPWEEIPGRYLRETRTGIVPDGFEDEICLALDLGEGLAVVAGCSHPGIVNMVSTIVKRLKKPVRIVVGGLHLAGAGKERIERTARGLRELGVCRAAVNHCSGEGLEEQFRQQGIENCRLRVGDCLYL